jgi:hypothetical protein
MSTAQTALKIGALVRASCSGCCCTEEDNCGVSGRIGVLANINEHNEDGDFYGVSFTEEAHLLYFWARELKVLDQITVFNEQQVDPPVCHRTGCPHQGPYNWATRRCTFEIASESELSHPFDHNGLFFSSRWVTLDLCPFCYRHLKSDGMLRRLSTAIIVGKEASSGN